MKTLDQTVPSKYKVEKRGETGLIVTSTDSNRCSVLCRLTEDRLGWEVGEIDSIDSKITCVARSSLIEHHRVIKNISSEIMTKWDSPKNNNNYHYTNNKQRIRQNHISQWAIKQVGKALAKKISPILKEIEDKQNPLALAIQRKTFATKGSVPHVVKAQEFYDKADKYYLKDIVNYKAAAHSVWFSESRIDFQNSFARCKNYPQKKIIPFDQLDNTQYFIDDERLLYSYKYGDLIYQHNWRDFYKYQFAEGYGSLDKMLSNFPNRIPLDFLEQINLIKFERPVYDRLELLFILACTKHHNWPVTNPPTKHVIQYCTNEEIKRCRDKYERFHREKFSLRKIGNISAIAQFIMDSFGNAVVHNRTSICGLMDDSIDYHHELRRNVSRGNSKIDDGALTGLPPVPLPENPNLIFLKTVGEIFNEGVLMKHCVSSYASKAVSKRCYLFHVEYKGQMATVEVDPIGYVAQSHGPMNHSNAASEYGRKELGKWAEQFKNPHVRNRSIMDTIYDVPIFEQAAQPVFDQEYLAIFTNEDMPF